MDIPPATVIKITTAAVTQIVITPRLLSPGSFVFSNRAGRPPPMSPINASFVCKGNVPNKYSNTRDRLMMPATAPRP